jgi:tetratricopeptide (TPR) repeat protein
MKGRHYAIFFSLFLGLVFAQGVVSTTDRAVAAENPTTPSPPDKEARRHYLIALEALKNDDLTVALDELKQAATLAPNNALIWYNIAIVESKKGQPKSALDHLHKAQALGIPPAQSEDVEALDSHLSYQLKMNGGQFSGNPHTLLAFLGGEYLSGKWTCRYSNHFDKVYLNQVNGSWTLLETRWLERLGVEPFDTYSIKLADIEPARIKIVSGTGWCEEGKASQKTEIFLVAIESKTGKLIKHLNHVVYKAEISREEEKPAVVKIDIAFNNADQAAAFVSQLLQAIGAKGRGPSSEAAQQASQAKSASLSTVTQRLAKVLQQAQHFNLNFSGAEYVLWQENVRLEHSGCVLQYDAITAKSVWNDAPKQREAISIDLGQVEKIGTEEDKPAKLNPSFTTWADNNQFHFWDRDAAQQLAADFKQAAAFCKSGL